MTLNILTLEEVMKELPSNIIVWAIPAMLSLVALEYFISLKNNHKLYENKDLLASIGIGVGNLLVTAVVKIVMFGVILFFYNLVPWRIPLTWWSFILCLIWLDFWRYWSHRIAHENRFWWATHITHHSSEKYNFSVSFRLSWVQHLKIIFFIPVAICGFHPVVFFIVHQIEVLYQFWIHTEYIRKLPKPIEYVFTTPSHHRVHHGRNEHYMDKNYGSTFIIWDRMFGTFIPEKEVSEYGITVPPNSYNPVYLVFHEWMDIFKDIAKAKNFKQAWKLAFIRPSKIRVYKESLLQEEKEKQKKLEEVSP